MTSQTTKLNTTAKQRIAAAQVYGVHQRCTPTIYRSKYDAEQTKFAKMMMEMEATTNGFTKMPTMYANKGRVKI